MTECTLTFPTGMSDRIEENAGSGVHVCALCKTYGKEERLVHALDGVDFEADRGQVTVLLGPNGAGKSTLLGCIAGVVIPTSGKVSVCGESEPDRIRAVAGYSGESGGLDGELTVAETLFFASRLHGTGKNEVRRAVSLTGISDVLGKKCRTLSKGYAQRVSLAKAICFDSPVLVLDEFTDGLDPAQTVSVRNAIKELAEEKTVIVSTHSMGEAEELGGIVYVLAHGQVVARGTGDEIIRKSGKKTLEEAFIGLTSMEI